MPINRQINGHTWRRLDTTDARAVVWAHNSHIGDARQTEMGQSRDELNIGQLCRERIGDDAALIGFGTDSGTVAATSDWDGEMEIKTIRPSLPESAERCSIWPTEAVPDRFRGSAMVAEALAAPRLERFIGVIYRSTGPRRSG